MLRPCWPRFPRRAEFGLESLFGALSAKKPQRTAFHERKFMALLDRPVESRGELLFTPPDRLEKRTTSPKAERVVVDRERITLERNGRTYGMGLRDNPGVAVLVESIRATLAGDLAALTRTYSAALDGNRAKWRLVLRPLTLGLDLLRIEIVWAATTSHVRLPGRWRPLADDYPRGRLSAGGTSPRPLAAGLASPSTVTQRASVGLSSFLPRRPPEQRLWSTTGAGAFGVCWLGWKELAGGPCGLSQRSPAAARRRALAFVANGPRGLFGRSASCAGQPLRAEPALIPSASACRGSMRPCARR